MLYKDQIAIANIPSSIMSRTIPGVGIGALPERLGSLGTANTPHIVAKIIGKLNTKTNLSHPSVCVHPQIPTEAKAQSSRMNRTAKLIG